MSSMKLATKGRLYYGWIVVTLSFITIALSATIKQSFIVIFPAMLKEFTWSRTVFSIAPALFGLVVSIVGFFIGYLSDKIDVKKLIPIGAVLASVGLALCFFIGQLWQMIVFFGVLCAVGASGLSLVPHTIIISNWFIKHRGTAIGIISSGSGAGTLAFIPLLQLVIAGWGWRLSYLAMAVFIGPLLIPLILLFQKSHPDQMGLKPLEKEVTSSEEGEPLCSRALLRNRRFWICFVQFILGPLSTMPIVIHQAALLQGKGLSSMGSAWAVGVYGLSVFCGMILSGAISDRTGREWSYTLGTVSILLGTVFLLSIPSGGKLILPLFFAFFFGLGFGTRPAMDSATAADIFKGRHFGLIYGILQLGLGIGLFCGPVLGGFIYDRSGTYTVAVVFCMVAVVMATGCIWAAAPRRGNEEALV